MQILYFGTKLNEKGFYLFDITDGTYKKIHNYAPKGILSKSIRLIYAHSNRFFTDGTVSFGHQYNGTFLIIAGSPTDKRSNTVSGFFTFESKDLSYESFANILKTNPLAQMTAQTLGVDFENVLDNHLELKK
jgi:hypothetical protein